MLRTDRTKEDLKNELGIFVWDFKVGDNIKYNLEVLFSLIDDYNYSRRDYKKPISIISVSVIEAVMIDFLYRLYDGTSHFPGSLKHLEYSIKSQLKNETIKSKIIGTNGEIHYYYTLKNFNFARMVEVYKKFKLLGDNEKVYVVLLSLAKFRNRIHINNYFNSFEKDENVTFSKERTQKTISIMIWLLDYFKKNYPRPWNNLTEK